MRIKDVLKSSIRKVDDLDDLNPKNLLKSLPTHVYWKDRDGLCLGCNDEFLAWVGLDELKGKTDFELPWRQEAASLQKSDLEVLRSGKMLEEEQTLKNNRGEQQQFLLQKSPLKNQENQIIGVVTVLINLDRFKTPELRLKPKNAVSASGFEEVLANLPGQLYWKDKYGVYQGCNLSQAKHLGLQTVAEVIGKTDFDLPLEKARIERYKKNDLEVMLTGQALIVEEALLLEDGNKTCLSYKTAMKNHQDEIIGVLGLSLEVAEKPQLLKVIEERPILKALSSDLLKDISHDLELPLLGLGEFGEKIEARVAEPELKAELRSLNTANAAALSLLQKLLARSAENSAIFASAAQEFNLKEQIAEVLSLYQAKMLTKHLVVIFNYDESIPPSLGGDALRIQRVLLELLANICQCTANGVVTISALLVKNEASEVLIQLIVEDNGPGFSQVLQQEITEQFEGVNPVELGDVKPKRGFSRIKGYMDDLKGEIYLQSTVDKGALFACLIPLQKTVLDEQLSSKDVVKTAMAKMGLQDKQQNTLGPKSLKHQVLLVEDNKIAALVVKTMMTALNCEIDHAADGSTGVLMANQKPYDLILMDIGLPDIDGYDATRLIREQEQAGFAKQVPVVAITAHTTEENKHNCLYAGMNAVITKPLTLDKAKVLVQDFIPVKLPEAANELPLSEPETPLAEPLVNGMFSDFIEDMELHLVRLDKACQAEDWLRLAYLIGKIKTASYYCGSERLKEILFSTELAIQQRDALQLADLCQLLFAEIKRIKEKS